jgi:very-short-patch-repair endonuclease
MSFLEKVLEAEIESCNLPPPVREYRFHNKRQWRLDFAWPSLKKAVEVEGGVWIKGRHTRGQGFIDDCEKYNEAALLGWLVLRLPGDWVENGRGIDYVKRLLEG